MKETKIEIPAGYEVEKTEVVDGALVVTFKAKERLLPKSWDEFCGIFPIPLAFAITKTDLDPRQDYLAPYHNRLVDAMNEFTADRATAEAVLALCQLIQLRNCYNGNWKPDWNDNRSCKYGINFHRNKINPTESVLQTYSPLVFKSEELRDQFIKNFRDLIEKLKPLYGIKEGGEK